ncbi:hypothetical protein LTR04_002008, partial [Oleoguttula sp. CCFEE 6159]
RDPLVTSKHVVAIQGQDTPGTTNNRDQESGIFESNTIAAAAQSAALHPGPDLANTPFESPAPMSVFQTTITTGTTTLLPPTTTLPQVLSLLHDHPAIITLNPLVVDYRAQPPLVSTTTAPSQLATPRSTNPTTTTYSITDALSYLPFHLWDTTVTYTADFEDTDDGLKTLVHAPAGLEIDGVWRVIRKEDAQHGGGSRQAGHGEQASAGTQTGCLVLEERTTATCNVFLKPFVQGTMKKSHDELHKRLVERLREGQK